MFPVLTDDQAGKQAKRAGTSYAAALRRDLQRAFVWARAQGDESVPAKGLTALAGAV